MKKYVAGFMLKYGDQCIRSYKSKSAAKRAVENARRNFQAPMRFEAFIDELDNGSRKTIHEEY